MGANLTPGANAGLSAERIIVAIGWEPAAGNIDASAFLCNAAEKVPSDSHFIFYNQPASPDGAVQFKPQAGSSAELRQQFEIDLSRLESQIEKIDVCLTIHDGLPNLGALKSVVARVLAPSGSEELIRFDVPVSGMAETAVILGSVYKRNGQWKFRAVGQGFVGGLAPLATHYGVDIAAESKAAPPPPPPAPKPSSVPPAGGDAPKPVNLSKVTLEKRGQSVSLEKKNAAGFGQIIFNLNWNQRPPEKKGGFLGGLFGGAKAIDLDLGCLWELTDGYKGAVQALGEAWGNYQNEPFIQHMGDDRTGAVSEGENIRINGDQLPKIRRILVYAFIYEGVPNWAAADGVATVKIPGHADIEVRLDNPASGQGMCAIALIENDGGRLKVTKEERYFPGHREMDQAYGWGMRWVAGSK